MCFAMGQLWQKKAMPPSPLRLDEENRDISLVIMDHESIAQEKILFSVYG